LENHRLQKAKPDIVALVTILVLTTACIPPQAKYAVSGTVSGSWQCINAGSSAMPTTVTLMPLEWKASFTHASPGFSFTDVPAGDHTLVVSCIAGLGRADYPGVPVTVSRADVYVDVILPFPTLPKRFPDAALAGHTGAIRSMAFSPDGSTLTSVSGDGALIRWDLATGEHLRSFLDGYPGSDCPSVLSSDGGLLAAGADDGTVNLWDTERGTLLYTLRDLGGRVQGLAFSSDSRMLAAWEANDSDRVALWDVTAGEFLRSLDVGQGRQIARGASKYVIFVQGGTTLVSVAQYDDGHGGDWTVTWWDVATGDVLKAFVLPNSIGLGMSRVNSVGVSSNETLFAFGTSGVENYGGLVIWDTSDGRITTGNYEMGLGRVAFSPDGALVGSTAFDNTVVLWDPVAGDARYVLASDVGGIHQFVWAPDGETMAAGDREGQVLVWETEGIANE
jgi:WD40 repeat protein